MARTMLSTLDNPYNPFTQFDSWKSYDEVVGGYFTSNLLARIAITSPDLTEMEMNRAIEDAIDEVCEMDLRPINQLTGKETLYVKVKEKENK